jgi:hypothetical protein
MCDFFRNEEAPAYFVFEDNTSIKFYKSLIAQNGHVNAPTKDNIFRSKFYYAIFQSHQLNKSRATVFKMATWMNQ